MTTGTADRTLRSDARLAAAVGLLAILMTALGPVLSGGPWSTLPGPWAAVAGAQEEPEPGSTEEDRVTTTTLQVENREFGDIIPAPNSGREPETPGDPGGWLQVSLFFILVGAVVLIVLAVWWQSRKARERRRAAGMDPVDVARRRGEGVRPPR